MNSTVGDLVQALLTKDQNAQLRFVTCELDELYVLSVYRHGRADADGTVWVDIGPDDSD